MTMMTVEVGVCEGFALPQKKMTTVNSSISTSSTASTASTSSQDSNNNMGSHSSCEMTQLSRVDGHSIYGLKRNDTQRKNLMRKSQTAQALNQNISVLASLKLDTNQTNDNEEEATESVQARNLILQKAEGIMAEKLFTGVQRGSTCPVCLGEDVDTELRPCKHRIHAKCIKRWVQTRTHSCPVCREPVYDIEKCFSDTCCPEIFARELQRQQEQQALLENQRGESSTTLSCDEAIESNSDRTSMSNESSSEYDIGVGEWGWFEDLTEQEEEEQQRNSEPIFSTIAKPEVQQPSTPLCNRAMSASFEFCRTFPPLRLTVENAYAESEYPWLRTVSSHRHIAAKLRIRSFRIVCAAFGYGEKFAEYLVEMEIDGKSFSRWKRYSSFARFVNTLGASEFRQSLEAWNRLTSIGRWFQRLEVDYLHRRCKLLEEFAHTLLQESTTLYQLADLLEC